MRTTAILGLFSIAAAMGAAGWKTSLGVSLEAFLQKRLAEDPTWASVRP